MLKVGLTGGIGSGKSVVASFFIEMGIVVIDADKVARQFTAAGSPLLAEIAAHFGAGILQRDGQLNRPQLRDIIFSVPDEKRWLENLLHPPIRTEIIALLEQSYGPYSVLESPLLFETHQDELVDKTVVVDVPEALQIQRASARDSSTEAKIKAIMATQMPRRKRLKKADYVVDNSGTLSQTQAQVRAIHEQLQAVGVE